MNRILHLCFAVFLSLSLAACGQTEKQSCPDELTESQSSVSSDWSRATERFPVCYQAFIEGELVVFVTDDAWSCAAFAVQNNETRKTVQFVGAMRPDETRGCYTILDQSRHDKLTLYPTVQKDGALSLDSDILGAWTLLPCTSAEAFDLLTELQVPVPSPSLTTPPAERQGIFCFAVRSGCPVLHRRHKRSVPCVPRHCMCRKRSGASVDMK